MDYNYITTRSIIGLFLVAVLISCEDSIRTSSLTVDEMKTATVNAFFYASLDHKQLGAEYAPDGTPVFIMVDYNELNPMAGQGSWRDTLEIINGMIEAEFPVSHAGSAVTLMPEKFIADQIQPHGSVNETVERIYSIPGNTVTIQNVQPGQKIVEEIIYVDQPFANQTEMVEIRFAGQAVFMEHYAEPDTLAPIPQGVDITLYTDDWAHETSAGSGGTFEAEVPTNKNINIEFVTQKRMQPDEDTVEFIRFKYTITTPAYQESTPIRQNFNFGTGTIWE